MTRANTEQLKHTPWFAKAGAACSIVPISRFVGANIFALKGGGYGCLFSLTGIDEEGLTDQELESRVRSIEGALRGLPEGSCLYQYMRVMSGFALPRQKQYVNVITETFATDRLSFLEKSAGFRRIDLHWCLTLEPSKAKAFERKPQENAADNSRMLADLEKTAVILQSHLGSSLGLTLLDKMEAFQFFSYLFNLEDWAERDQLRSDTAVDRQIVKNPVAWHSDYVQVGKRHVQMFSLKTTPEASRPCLFSGLMTLDCDSILCSTWRVKSTSAARSDPGERITAIAKDYAAHPQNTIIVSPDNRSRQQINEAVRIELRDNGVLADSGHEFPTLSHRGDMTGADRVWAARYNVGDVLQYTTGSKSEGIERGSYATVRNVNARENTLTVERDDGQSVTYDPRRLRGVNVFQEVQREFASGDRLQFTQPNKTLGIANRDLGTILAFEDGQLSVRMDGKSARTVTFDPAAFRHFDHGYAVTSHSSQGMTTGRVLANFDTESSYSLINSRLAYVAISRASDDARIYTNNAETLGQRLATDVSKTSALDFRPPGSTAEVQAAVAAFRTHDPVAGTTLLQQQGRIHEYANPEHRLASVALAYASKDDRAVVIAPDADERRELTQLIRDELRQQGRLAVEGHTVPVLVEQHFGNPRLAANYAPDDKIHYRAGSPAEHGIADNSTVTVQSVDARANTLTVQTLDTNEVSYNPALAKKLTGQSTVFREEHRDLAIGERIQLNQSDQRTPVRSGDFATVERIGEDNSLSVRLDNGKSVELDSERARHIDYGYAVEGSYHGAADRVLITGDALQLAQEEKMFSHLSSQTRDLALYTSDSRELVTEKAFPNLEVGMSRQDGIASSLDNLATPSVPALPVEELGIGL